MMGRIFSALAGWKGYAAAALIAGLLAAGVAAYFTALPYRLEISGLKLAKASDDAARATAAVDHFVQTAAEIHAAADQFTAARGALGSRLDAISKDFHNATQARPLPAGCQPDAARLLFLTQAVAAANSAAGYGAGPAVPTHP